MSASQVISAYEQQRLDNIRRNQEYLESLGIDKVKPVRVKAESSTKKRPRRSSSSSKENYFDDEEIVNLVEPSRRSKRVQNLTPDGEIDLEKLNTEDIQPRRQRERHTIEVDIDEEGEGRVAITASQLQEYIEANLPDHLELIANETIVHEAYRLSYMSNKALATRLKQIARSANKGSHEKLLAFYFALKLANLEQLAASAQVALSHLGRVIDN